VLGCITRGTEGSKMAKICYM